jgi:hypothetical protein
MIKEKQKLTKKTLLTKKNKGETNDQRRKKLVRMMGKN